MDKCGFPKILHKFGKKLENRDFSFLYLKIIKKYYIIFIENKERNNNE